MYFGCIDLHFPIRTKANWEVLKFELKGLIKDKDKHSNNRHVMDEDIIDDNFDENVEDNSAKFQSGKHKNKKIVINLKNR